MRPGSSSQTKGAWGTGIPVPPSPGDYRAPGQVGEERRPQGMSSSLRSVEGRAESGLPRLHPASTSLQSLELAGG